MARTSKTVIGGGSGAQSDRMMKAATSGQAAISDAQNRLQREQHFQQQQSAQTSRDVVGIFERFEQGKEQTRQFDEQQGLRKKGLELEGAKAGFELKDEKKQEKGGAADQGDERRKQLEDEMARGAEQTGGIIGPLEKEDQDRLAEQGEKPMELGAGGAWQPTKERKQEKAAEQRTGAFKADTERIRAEAYRDQIGVQAQKALAAGNVAEFKALAQQLANRPNDRQMQYDRLNRGDINSNDWSDLTGLAAGSEEADPTLMADIKAKQFTPRVSAFVRSQVASESLKAIVRGSGSTNFLEIDWTNPKMMEFSEERAFQNTLMASSPVLQQMSFINSTMTKMQFLNVFAASRVLTGQTQRPASPTPSTEAPPGAPEGGMAPPPLIEQSEGTARPGAPGAGAEAVTAARAGGASPQESLQAGQAAQPTGGKKPSNDFLQGMGGFGPK